jgi:hypothetical protein
MEELREIIELNKEVSVNSFYQALYIYLKKPQVVNRKLSCSNNIALVRFDKNCDFERVEEIFENAVKSKQPLQVLETELKSKAIEHTFETLDALNNIHDEESCKLISLDRITSKNNISCFQTALIGMCLLFLTSHCLTPYLITDKTQHRASFYPFDNASKILPLISYTIEFNENRLRLLVSRDDYESDACNWLRFVLLKKIQNWMESYEEGSHAEERIESHSLIDNVEYSRLYACLKEKYGKEIEGIWTEEVTDPKKFIYEDIAICAYLMTLWKRQREENGSDGKQSFVDFGCGNGLLVYLLTQEGHRGYGIDLRKRKIWDKFTPQIDLREVTWTPENNFSDVDWIIGNHSDELSPWVPVVSRLPFLFDCAYI